MGRTVRLIVEIAAAMKRELSVEQTAPVWTAAVWSERMQTMLSLISKEDSAYRLGQVLSYDSSLSLPVSVVKATYERLFELGADDAFTKLCYAGYLMLHGPEWDEEAQVILDAVRGPTEAAGLWEGSLFGHLPVFYSGPA